MSSLDVRTQSMAILRAYWTTIKLSLMVATLFWIFVYMLSEAASKVPEFVYVNF